MYHQYKDAKAVGLPAEQGNYFLLLVENKLIFAELGLSDGQRNWTDYATGLPVDETKIQLWRKINTDVPERSARRVDDDVPPVSTDLSDPSIQRT